MGTGSVVGLYFELFYIFNKHGLVVMKLVCSLTVHPENWKVLSSAVGV